MQSPAIAQGDGDIWCNQGRNPRILRDEPSVTPPSRAPSQYGTAPPSPHAGKESDNPRDWPVNFAMGELTRELEPTSARSSRTDSAEVFLAIAALEHGWGEH